MKDLAEITAIIENRYGVGVAVAPTVTCIWAAERCTNPRNALRALNKIRERHGTPIAHAPFGHVAF